MPISPREMLHRLFVYIEEQLKDIDPRAFQIGKSALPRLFPKDLTNLPGVFFDVQEEGDHVWLKVEHLEESPPPVSDSEKFGKATSHGFPNLVVAYSNRDRLRNAAKLKGIMPCPHGQGDSVY